MNFEEVNRFIKSLKRTQLTAQQKRTLKGQAIAGDLKGAQKGMEALLRRQQQNRMKEAK